LPEIALYPETYEFNLLEYFSGPVIKGKGSSINAFDFSP